MNSFYQNKSLINDKNARIEKKLIEDFKKDLSFLMKRKPIKKFSFKIKKITIFKRTAAIIVTYNNLDFLKELLYDFCYSIAFPENIIIVNNNSQDDTKTFLNNFFNIKNENKENLLILNEKLTLVRKKINKLNIHLITTQKNIGGSGGFATGLYYAKNILKSKWFFTMDDDIRIPQDLMKKVYKLREKKTAITGTMLSSDNPMHVIEIGNNLNKNLYINFGFFAFSPFNLKNYLSLIKNYKNNEIKANFSAFAFSFFSSHILNNNLLSYIKNFFIHLDDAYFFLKNKIKIISFLQIRFWHKLGEKNSFFNWVKFYDVRNTFFIIKNLFPKTLHNAKINFLKDLKILLNQCKYELVENFVRCYQDGIKGKLGEIEYINKNNWKNLKDFSLKNKQIIAFIDYTGSLFQIGKVIKEIKKQFKDIKIDLYTVKTFETEIIDVERILEINKIYYWNKTNLFNRFFNFLKYNLFITSFSDVPRILNLFLNKKILFYQEKGNNLLFYKSITSPLKYIKIYLNLKIKLKF